jgi:hypothetical protein
LSRAAAANSLKSGGPGQGWLEVKVSEVESQVFGECVAVAQAVPRYLPQRLQIGIATVMSFGPASPEAGSFSGSAQNLNV